MSGIGGKADLRHAAQKSPLLGHNRKRGLRRYHCTNKAVRLGKSEQGIEVDAREELPETIAILTGHLLKSARILRLIE